MKSFIYEDLNLLIEYANSFPILTQEEVEKILNEKESLIARDKIINCNLKLVISIAKKYIKNTESFTLLDLIQEGIIGLIRSIETYDESKSSFSTYATIWIEQAIRRSIKINDKLIRKPDYFINLNYRYNKLIDEYNEKYKIFPDDEYILKKLNITKDLLYYLKNNDLYNYLSYNTKINQEDTDSDEIVTLLEGTSDTNELLESFSSIEYLNVIRSVLKEEEYYILYNRVFAPKKMTFIQFSKIFGIGREAVRQREKRIFNKLKPFCDSNSHLFNKTLASIRKNNKYYDLRLEPMTPENICIYLYLKNYLDDIEKNILYLILLDKYNYTENEIMNMLNINNSLYNSIINKLKLLIRNEINNSKDFNNFKNELIKEYGFNIFKIDLFKKIDLKLCKIR